MKRSTKIALILGSILILLGIVLVTVSLALTGGDLLAYETGGDYERMEDVYDAGEISAVTLSCTASDVILRHADDGKFRVIRYENEEISYQVQKLYYVLNGEKSIHLKISENDPNRKLSFHIHLNPETCRIVLEIPDAQENITIRTASGDIRLDGITVRDTLDLHAVSGDISLSSLHAGTCLTETTSGDVHVADTDIHAFTIATTSGDVTLRAVSAKENSSIKTVSGDVKCTDGVMGAHLSVTTTSGEIDATDTQIVCADFVSTSGDVDIQLYLDPEKRSFFSKETVSGTVKYVGTPHVSPIGSQSESGELPSVEEIEKTLIRVKTVSGDITVRFIPREQGS
ncbi:MAG: DUF4097 family beta strand repeat protein [Clostridia bacterium]|nr:DUF4097 family beta strand repeat protein [Clostridia bacterium]